MAVIKCKMCGGTLEIAEGLSVATCEYCGTNQTLPRLSDDRIANLYDRANHFRRNNEYDKAMGIYEQILNEDSTDAEAYWSLVLCRYGIEYVEDPATHKRVPTVNRAQFTSVYDDDNYKSALENADLSQKTLYEEEAKAINEIQKGILAISQKEDPFDVFICYKETDSNGRRTPDSVMAQDLYYQLVQEGFKVFFARITLEEKLGSAYEPYIFAALNSAKVMVVLGTKPEHFNAVWVRNEWSRYLSLIKGGAKKILVPAYRDMDPYDLPDEFSHLQAQDMSKLGFMQDLIRGIKKIIEAQKPKAAPAAPAAAPTGTANIDTFLQRVKIFLEDQDWSSASIYCEKVLDIVPTNGQAYLYKLLTEARVSNERALESVNTPLENFRTYKNAVRYADEATTAKLIELNQTIKTRVQREEEARIATEDLRRRKAELSSEIDDVSSMVAAKEYKKQLLVSRLDEISNMEASRRQQKRKLLTRSLIVCAIALMVFIGACTGNDVLMVLGWLAQFVFAVRLALARGRSVVGAIAMTFFSVGMLPFFPSLSGIREGLQLPVKDLVAEKISLNAEIRQLDEILYNSQASLRELDSKKQALEGEKPEANY